MRRWSNTADDNYTTTGVKYRAEEYEALSGEVVQEDKNGEFMREATYVEQFGLPCVKNISLIHKVREVQALVGFRDWNHWTMIIRIMAEKLRRF